MLIIILIISIILTLSGCISKSKENSEKFPSEKNKTQIPGNNTTQIQDIINIFIPKPYSKYQDDRFLIIVKEANDIIGNNNAQLMVAAEKGNFEDLEKYGKDLELKSSKYMLILKGLTVSSRFTKMYVEYYNYLENMNKAGKHIQESARNHKSIDNGSCNNPSSNGQQSQQM